MATIYTSNIVSPALCAFHDIEGIENIQHWVDSESTLSYPQGVEYPFYNKLPTWPTSLKTHYGFAPHCTITFNAYGSQFFNTTAHYIVYDEYQTDPGSGGFLGQEIDKYIPGFIQYPTPPSGVLLSEVSGTSVAAVWYITISKHPVDDDKMLTSSYMMYGIAINDTSYNALIDLQNEVPEINFTTFNTGTSLQLNYSFIPSLIRSETENNDAVYNIAVNSIKIPSFLDNLTTSKYICSISSSSLIHNTDPVFPLYGGKAYTYIHNDIDGALIETKFASGSRFTQDEFVVRTPDFPEIKMFITDSGALSCELPPTTGPWQISGLYIDQYATDHYTPLKHINTNIEQPYTLIDTITGFDMYPKSSIWGQWLMNGGAVSVKYDLVIDIDDEYTENRIFYVNWYDLSAVNVVENVVTEDGSESSRFTLSATCIDNIIKVYGIPLDDTTHTCVVCGYKTEIDYTNINPFTRYINTSGSDLLSGSWIGEMEGGIFGWGDILPKILDTTYYYRDFDPFHPEVEYKDSVTGYSSAVNYGGTWEILLVMPGGDLILRKTLNTTWSDPNLYCINSDEQTHIVLDKYSEYSEISASIKTFSVCNFLEAGCPVYICFRSNKPLETYAARHLYSSEDVHLNNVTSWNLLTSQISTGTDVIADRYELDIEANKQGKRYNILTSQLTDSKTRSIYDIEQISTITTDVTGESRRLIDLVYVPELEIDNIKDENSISLEVSSIGPEYYIAGYNIPNNTVYMDIENDASIVVISPIVDLDTIYIRNSYDAEWHVTLSHNDSAARIDKIMTLFIDDVDGDAHQRFVYKKQQIKSDIVNSSRLDCIDIFPVYNYDEGTITLRLTCEPECINELSGVQLFWYRDGVSNYSLKEVVDPTFPEIPAAGVNHTFIYPGTYSISVSALSGDPPEAVYVLNYKDYFRILDIPPLVRFDITNTLPSTIDYEPVLDGDVRSISYYNNYSPYIILDKYNVYINTWTTAPGSFPVNELWIDYGDGSPVEKIIRGSSDVINYGIESIAFSGSKTDPRNHIFNHTYNISDNELHTYTITVTAFSLNTNTYSIGSRDICGIGSAGPTKKYLLNNTLLTNNTVIYNVQADSIENLTMNTAATAYPIKYNDERYYNILTEKE